MNRSSREFRTLRYKLSDYFQRRFSFERRNRFLKVWIRNLRCRGFYMQIEGGWRLFTWVRDEFRRSINIDGAHKALFKERTEIEDCTMNEERANCFQQRTQR